MNTKILAKLPAEEGCHVVVMAVDEEGKQVWAETDDGKRPMVRAIPLGFLGFVATESFGAFAAMLGLGSSPSWVPLDTEGAEIERPIAYLMPGETLQDWAAKSLAEETERKAQWAAKKVT